MSNFYPIDKVTKLKTHEIYEVDYYLLVTDNVEKVNANSTNLKSN